MIDTIIWDLDGTLLNTLEDLTNSVNHALTTNSLPPRKQIEIRRFLGNGIKNLIQQSVPENTSEELFEKTFSSFRIHYMEHCQDKTRPYEGLLPLLKKLKEEGYKMAIVSNKVDNAVKELNEKFFKEYIPVAIGEKEGLRRKPAPDMVFKAIEALHSTPEAAIYIGDSEVDYQTANNAEVPCISVLWGFRDENFLASKGAKIFAHEPSDIKDLLSQIALTNA